MIYYMLSISLTLFLYSITFRQIFKGYKVAEGNGLTLVDAVKLLILVLTPAVNVMLAVLVMFVYKLVIDDMPRFTRKGE